MNRLTKLFVGIAFAGAGLMSGQDQCGKYSTLGQIDCGGGQATCNNSDSGVVGAVRCTCTATCLSAQSVSLSVSATRGVVWGVGSACLFSLSGNATGGTTNGPGSVWTTSVFATVTLTGIYLSNPFNRSSTQQSDCFQGSVQNDPVIAAVC